MENENNDEIREAVGDTAEPEAVKDTDKAAEPETEKDTDKGNDEKEEESFFGDILEIFESIVISVFAVLLIFTFVARPVTVDGSSMNPTLEDSDKLIMDTFLYTPENGDIVVIDNNASYTYGADGSIVKGAPLPRSANDGTKRIIKRVIAVGGQEIDIDFDKGEVRVDGKTLHEDYIADLTHRDLGAFQSYPVKVPEGYVFVMGDNRNNSSDSRAIGVGFVKEEDILGKAVLRFYPFDKLGSVG